MLCSDMEGLHTKLYNSLIIWGANLYNYRVMLNHRILIMNDGLEHNVIKVKPPLCFTRDNADALLRAIDTTLEELQQ